MSFFEKYQTEVFKFDNKLYQMDDLTDVVINDPAFSFNSAYLQPYYIRPGARPDIIADILYSDVNYWWIFFIANGITINEWPLDYDELNEWIDKTYTEHEQHLVRKYKDDDSNEIPGVAWYTFSVDGVDQYHQRNQSIENTGYTRRHSAGNLLSVYGGDRVTLYEELHETNEARRFIKVPKPEYIEQFKTDFFNRLSEQIAY